MRLRVWHQPLLGFSSPEDVKNLAKRAHDHGLQIVIDFHYSDWWADPGKQNKPNAWSNQTCTQLKSSVTQFTSQVVASLVAQVTPASYVQIGNEITNGLLWPDGQLGTHDQAAWGRFSELITAGVKGVSAGRGASRPKILLHIDRGGDKSLSLW